MFFVVPENGPALLGMPDIDNLGVLTMNFEAIGRHHKMIMQTTGRKTANTKEQFKQKAGCLRAVQTRGRMKKQKTQDNAYNTADPSVITNPMVMGNNNNDNSFLSHL